MTEQQWNECGRPNEMLMFLLQARGLIYKSLVQQHPRGRRRLRLLNVAVARRVAHLSSTDPATLLEAAEGRADGSVSKDVMADAAEPWRVTHYPHMDDDVPDYYYRNVLDAYGREELVSQVLFNLRNWWPLCGNAALALEGEKAPTEYPRQCHLIRDIFGNPFRPTTLVRAWRTTTVVALARAAYEERRLPSGELDALHLCVLADALEEIVAPDEIVSHLRSPGPHVRGCWAVDLCLGLV